MKRVLVVDDDRRMRRTLQLLVTSMGLDAVAAAGAAEAEARLRDGGVDLVLTDLRLPEVDGVELLRRIKARDPALPVVLITAYGSIQTAIAALKAGAADYVLKPFDNDALAAVIRRALELERVRAENAFLKGELGESWAAEDVLVALPGMRAVAELLARIAPTSAPVLVTGETGTGKELAARWIHSHSPRRDALFVPLNCAALPADLLEAELFGHARGAFTGAERDRAGKFEVADGGTLFLDEIGDMPVGLQAKLLRIIEDGVVERLGGSRPLRVDVRLVSATNQALDQAIAARRFRADLFYRLNTFELPLPALRERPADVTVLAPLLLDRFARQLGRRGMRLSPAALALLRAHDWPGNVRELRNLMERAAVLSPAAEVTDRFFAAMVPPPVGGAAADDASAAPDAPLRDAVQRAERSAILRALDAAGGNKADAARRLGIGERTLWYKLRRLGL